MFRVTGRVLPVPCSVSCVPCSVLLVSCIRFLVACGLSRVSCSLCRVACFVFLAESGQLCIVLLVSCCLFRVVCFVLFVSCCLYLANGMRSEHSDAKRGALSSDMMFEGAFAARQMPMPRFLMG